MNHKVTFDGLYGCKSKQALRYYESDLFSYAKGEQFEGKCIVCQHKLDLAQYMPAQSKFDLLRKTFE